MITVSMICSPKFAKANPDNKNVAVVGKAGGEAWKSLSEADKSVYVKKADAAKAKFAVDHPEVC
jgi:high mobility group protein B1